MVMEQKKDHYFHKKQNRNNDKNTIFNINSLVSNMVKI